MSERSAGAGGLSGGPPMGFDEVMIVNPAFAGQRRAVMFGDVYTGYGQVPEEPLNGFGQENVELRPLGEVFLGADGNLYEATTGGACGPLGEVVLGDDGGLYEAAGFGQEYVPRPEPLEGFDYYGQVPPEEAMAQVAPEEVAGYWGQVPPEEAVSMGWYGQIPPGEEGVMGWDGQDLPEEAVAQVPPEDVSGYWGQAPPEEVLQEYDQGPMDGTMQGYVSVPFQPQPGEVPGQAAYRPAVSTRHFPSDIFRPHF